MRSDLDPGYRKDRHGFGRGVLWDGKSCGDSDLEVQYYGVLVCFLGDWLVRLVEPDSRTMRLHFFAGEILVLS